MVAVTFPFTHDSEAMLTELLAPGEQVVATAPSRFGRLVVVAREGRRTILQNGVRVAATKIKIKRRKASICPCCCTGIPGRSCSSEVVFPSPWWKSYGMPGAGALLGNG